MGAFATNPQTDRPSLRALFEALGRGDGSMSLADPSSDPIVGMTLAENCLPTVEVARQADGAFVVVDGEIFNGPDLCADDPSGALPPAEALLRAYRKEGEAVFARLDGAAMITLWDAARGRLLIVRDPVGGVPVFWAERQGIVTWASDLPALLHAGASPDVDPVALDAYLASGFVPAPWTFSKAVKRLPPGHLICLEPGKPPSLRKYWSPSARPRLELSAAAAEEQLAALLSRAVARRSDKGADGLGLLLSGGVDSKLLLALMVEQQMAPEAFTFRYGGYDGVFNEGERAREGARHFKVEHSEIGVEPGDVIDNMETMLRAFGEPFSYGLHSFMLGAVKTHGISRLLCGAGADGWFLGRRETSALTIQGLPGPVRWMAGGAPTVFAHAGGACRAIGLGGAGRRLARAGRRAAGVLEAADSNVPYDVSDFITAASLRADLYADSQWLDRQVAARQAQLQASLDELAGEPADAKFKLMTLRYFGADMNLNWYHRCARAHDLSIRTPYYDRELLEFVLRLPSLSGDKEELRRYARTYMPDDMAAAQKVPQTIPLGPWMRGPLKGFVHDQLSSSRIARQGLFEPTAVERLLANHMAGQANHAWTLWGLLLVLNWQEQFAQV